MIAAWLTACRPDPDPDPTTETAPPPVSCPPVSWAVQVTGLYHQAVDQVFALPDGDVVVVGRGTGLAALGTDGVTVDNNGQARLVARLDARDGHTRWAHAIGADAFWPRAASLGPDSVWVSGAQTWSGPLQLDYVEVPGVPLPVKDDRNLVRDAFAAQFDLESGALRRVVYLASPSLDEAHAVAEDPDGNVYVTGEYEDAELTLAPGVALPEVGSGPNAGDSAWLASWDRSGGLRWAVAAKWARPEELAVTRAGLLWSVVAAGDDGLLWPDGSVGSPLDPGSAEGATVVYPVDASTGRPGPSRVQIRTPNVDWTDLGDPIGDDVGVAGWLLDPYQVTLADGRTVTGGGNAFTGRLSPNGELEDLRPLPVGFGKGGDYGRGAFSVSSSAIDVVFNEGTPAAFTVPGNGRITGRSGLAGWYDEDGLVECLWDFDTAGIGDAADATRDEHGGFVVVGSFDSELNVFDRDRNLVQSMPKGYLDFSVDGFVIRFAWPDE